MPPDTDVAASHLMKDNEGGPNPWKFIPLMYLMQAMPVAVIQELSSVFYKDLGVEDSLIATWTSIVALPWSLQFLLGPLVDLSAKKRQWIRAGQLIMVALFALLPFLMLPGNKGFSASLIFLGAFAFVSAMTNIATDGFYMLTNSKETQANFAGVQTAFFRFGRLLCIALVPFLVGKMMVFSPVTVQTTGSLRFAVKGNGEKEKSYLNQATFTISQGELTTTKGQRLLDDKDKPIIIPGIANEFEVQNGVVRFGETRVPIGLYRLGKLVTEKPEDGSWQPTKYPTVSQNDTFEGASGKRKIPAPLAWMLSLFSVALIYAISAVGLRQTLPESHLDQGPSDTQKAQFRPNLIRTLAILGLYGSGYFSASALWKLAVHPIGLARKVEAWTLKDATFFGFEFSKMPAINAELIQLSICLPLSISLVLFLRKSLKGTEMQETFTSFLRQPGIIPILFFMLFYRFAEAMVAKMSVLFLKADLDKGGLALDNTQIGLIKGAIGVAGIICGGIVGGLLVGKLGLKKGFWIIAALMHIPIVLYVYAAYARPSSMPVIGAIDFIDQFGYGLGYAGYTVYLMRIAQRGNHRTAHYAFGTGLGATFIALSGILGGVIQSAGQENGYKYVFLAALLFSIPGLITLKFIPHDDE
jgi:MFS transporter, PAT family, beta-lactamase induction signal transducer AmpG